jgi:pimeloyl-ACP methyl ester carboxylesterase
MATTGADASPYQIDGARHRLVETNGVVLSVYEAGDASAPAVLFSHGFPELAYSWRHQLPALADAGFRAIAPDQRGYGGSGRPDGVDDYDIFHLTGDLVGVLDALEIDRAVFVGHDWGGIIVWQMPFLHRERVAGVVGLNTPHFPRLPMRPVEVFREAAGESFYIVAFQEPEVADRVFADNVETVFDRMMRRGVEPEALREAVDRRESNDFVELVVNAPVLGEPLMRPEELAVFVETFQRTGFTGGINWYRNFDRNWELTADQDDPRIDGIPCLMITAAWDPVLAPALASGMPSLIDDLEMHEIPRCGHWTQQEHPDEVNRLLVDWLRRRVA